MKEKTVKEFVISDFRTAAVFERHGIDFCCGGNISLERACAESGIDVGTVMDELQRLSVAASSDRVRFEQWDLDILAEHIVTAHHNYVKAAIPVLLAHTAKVANVHGDRHPEVTEIYTLFQNVAAEMTTHMQKEELMLFPSIRSLARARREGTPAPRAPFGSIANPIRQMESEHVSAGNTMGQIHRLSAGYQPPPDACTTYRVSYQELQNFELDLHTHVHLENNILFPGAVALETALSKTSFSLNS